MKREVITYKEPKSPISEIFRNLRTSVQFANTKRGLHTLLVTSTNPGEGKSWISVNLAVTFAQAGKKVILVDCDMRKGRQFSIFDVAPTPGLSNYLSGINSDGEESSESILSYIKETPVDNLFVIPAGNVPPNPSELLVSDAMAQAIDDLKMICDLVIFDGTPCNLVTDSIIMSRYVDTTIIVSAYKKTKMDEIEAIKKNIENVGGKIAGVVINRTKMTQKQYYSTYYYGNYEADMKNQKEYEEEIKNSDENMDNIANKEREAAEKAKPIKEVKKAQTAKTTNRKYSKNKGSNEIKEKIAEAKEKDEVKRTKKKAKELEESINEKLGEGKEEE